MRVVLMHGEDTDPTKKWYPWLAEEMRKFDVDFVAPVLPDAHDPILHVWLAALEKTKPDQGTIFIGHSRGGVTILRWLERLSPRRRVRGVILIATNSGGLKKGNISENDYGFFTEGGYDFTKIRSHCDDFVVLHSRDDQWVPFEAGKENVRGLHARFLVFDDRGHFGKGVDAIPELLEEIIHFDARKALLIPINAKRQVLIQDRRGHIEPAWGYFGGEIEPGERPLAAVIRESKEELALDIQPHELKYLGASTTNWSGRKIIRYMYLYRTNQKDFHILEGAGACWLPYDEARKRLLGQDRFDEVVVWIEKSLRTSSH